MYYLLTCNFFNFKPALCSDVFQPDITVNVDWELITNFHPIPFQLISSGYTFAEGGGGGGGGLFFTPSLFLSFCLFCFVCS